MPEQPYALNFHKSVEWQGPGKHDVIHISLHAPRNGFRQAFVDLRGETEVQRAREQTMARIAEAIGRPLDARDEPFLHVFEAQGVPMKTAHGPVYTVIVDQPIPEDHFKALAVALAGSLDALGMPRGQAALSYRLSQRSVRLTRRIDDLLKSEKP